MCEFTVEVV